MHEKFCEHVESAKSDIMQIRLAHGIFTLLMYRARYHLYKNPIKSQKKMRLNPGPRMRRGGAELESTSPADFNVSNRSTTFSILSKTLFDCSSLFFFVNESCRAMDGVTTKEGCVRTLRGAKAVVDAKTRPSRHNRLKRSILCTLKLSILLRLGILFNTFAAYATGCRGTTMQKMMLATVSNVQYDGNRRKFHVDGS